MTRQRYLYLTRRECISQTCFCTLEGDISIQSSMYNHPTDEGDKVHGMKEFFFSQLYSITKIRKEKSSE